MTRSKQEYEEQHISREGQLATAHRPRVSIRVTKKFFGQGRWRGRPGKIIFL